jgi:hypothetical protein
VRKTQIDQGIVDKMEIQKENIMRAIRKIPELKEYAFPDIKEKAKATKGEHDGIDAVEIEKRDTRDVVVIEDEPIPTDERGRKPKKVQTRKAYFIWVAGKKFRIEHSFVDLKTEDVMKDKIVDDETGIHVFTNIAFPAFANTKDQLFYAAWHITEAVAEVMVEKNKQSSSEILKIRDLILKKTSEITQELDQVEQEKKLAEKLKKEYEEKMLKIKDLQERHK